MNEAMLLLGTAVSGHDVVRGKVVAVSADGVLVSSQALGEAPRLCEVLHTSKHGPVFSEGDRVLIWTSQEEGERDIVLGRIGLSGSPVLPPALGPEELTLEAKKSLTIRCGSGSITIREDGKILIKGKDLVSHAQRLNRIKGGAAQIN